jgi:hypothetical protein
MSEGRLRDGKRPEFGHDAGFQEYLLLVAVLAAVNTASRRLWRWPDHTPYRLHAGRVRKLLRSLRL